MSDRTESEIVRRQLNSDANSPSVQIVEAIADLEGTDAAELPPIYDCIDGMLENLFSRPPAPDAQMEIEFTYTTYRVTIEQDGIATFVSVEYSNR